MSQVLIAYESPNGSTKEVVEKMIEIFKAAQISADAMEISSVHSLENYQLIIIGAPINGFKWLPSAEGFVAKHQATLKNKKVAYFALTYLGVEGRPFFKNKMEKTLDHAVQLVTPCQKILFGGKVKDEFPTLFRWIFGIRKDAPKDLRDFKKIEAWTREVAKVL